MRFSKIGIVYRAPRPMPALMVCWLGIGGGGPVSITPLRITPRQLEPCPLAMCSNDRFSSVDIDLIVIFMVNVQ